MKPIHIIVILTLLELGIGSITSAQTMDNVRKTITKEKLSGITPGNLPSPSDELEGDITYTYNLLFTFAAISTDTYIDLFSGATKANDVVSRWKSRIDSNSAMHDPVYRDLRSALNDLQALLATNDYRNLPFSTMVEYRLEPPFPDRYAQLDLELTKLVEAHFSFPLFDRSHTGSVRQRLKTLASFVRIRTGPDDGGFGNVGFRAVYYMPALPREAPDGKGISENFRWSIITPALDGGVIPQGKLVKKADFVAAGTGGADMCCCNNSKHPEYRTCDSETGSYCAMSGTECVVGSNNCRASHHH